MLGGPVERMLPSSCQAPRGLSVLCASRALLWVPLRSYQFIEAFGPVSSTLLKRLDRPPEELDHCQE